MSDKEQRAWEAMMELYIMYLRKELEDGFLERMFEELKHTETKEQFLEGCREQLNIKVGEHENKVAEVFKTRQEYGVYDLKMVALVCKHCRTVLY